MAWAWKDLERDGGLGGLELEREPVHFERRGRDRVVFASALNDRARRRRRALEIIGSGGAIEEPEVFAGAGDGVAEVGILEDDRVLRNGAQRGGD